ncbi:hypothetical protein [Rhodopirellula europaea]|uniref:hypothetical protein n=1 Tax=Rhodopirellula europaea TaxID=1263866 RepID=UPI003D26ED34|tara:strand:+ start:8314 stop:8643 length:330 start_codon:yes stop_codon:yes gene_type:complete
MSDYYSQASQNLPLFDFGATAAETKAAAAKAAKPKRKVRSVVALERLQRAGADGLTRDELAAAMDLPIQSVCSVALQILRSGDAVEDGRKRKTACGHDAAVIVLKEFAK